MSRLFALDRNGALKEVRAVVRVVETWKEHFKTHGVTRGDIELKRPRRSPAPLSAA